MAMNMTSGELFDLCKSSLRIVDNAFDNELLSIIDACFQDLSVSGVNPDRESVEPLIAHAVKFYCKANFGFREDSEKYMERYESLKKSLSLSAKSQHWGEALGVEHGG